MDEKVFIKKSTLTSIGNAIRSKEGTTELIPPLEMPARIEAISGGVNYLDYCQNFNIWSLNLFGTPKVELTLPLVTSLRLTFFVDKNDSDTEGRTNTTVEELIVHCPNTITNMYAAFGQSNYYADKTLKKITMDFETNSNNWQNTFNNLQALEVIDGEPINLTPAGDSILYAFDACYLLREVHFKGTLSQSIRMRYSSNLSKDSINSLMACLSAEATGKTITLSQTAVNTAFETSEGAADGSTSAEWLALVEAHSNWTISLV